jgi:eukaryotic-like serine/threonine-protein kinase
MPESPKGSPPFARCVETSQLATREQVRQAAAELRAQDEVYADPNAPIPDEVLADKLVATGLLNSWQASQLLLGRTKFSLGPYRIVDSLGQGGMGQVFKAEHELLHQVRAVKVLPIGRSTPEAVEGFHREIRAQAGLDHDNLVRAFDAGEDGNVHYLVSEYVPGSDLRRLVRKEGPLEMERAAKIIIQVADALTHAHEQGLIHRDVKPSNVLVTPEDEAKLSDLGLAGPLGTNGEDTPRYGRIAGTADYLAPDQILQPGAPSPLWDVYSLGCTLFYAVTGRLPFLTRGSRIREVVKNIADEPQDPRTLVLGLQDDFVEIIMTMMASSPEKRYGSAEKAGQSLRDWMAQRTGDAERKAVAAKRAEVRSRLTDPKSRKAKAVSQENNEETPRFVERASPSSAAYWAAFFVFIGLPLIFMILILLLYYLLSLGA